MDGGIEMKVPDCESQKARERGGSAWRDPPIINMAAPRRTARDGRTIVVLYKL